MQRLTEIKGKLMGVDFGDVRTGLAISDPSRLLASGIGFISPGGIEKTADAIAEAAQREGAVAIVVGLPVNMDGSEGPRTDVIRAFAALLAEATDIPIDFYDERMSTMVAYRFLDETGTFGKKRKNAIDTLSAEIILQGYIDRERQMTK